MYENILKDPVAFFKFVTGIEPYDYQKEFLKCEDQKIALRWARQTGKSTVAAIKLLYWAFTNPKEEIVIIGAFRDQASHFFDKVREACQNDFIKPYIVRETQTQIHFENGSKIYCFPAGRGKSRTGFSPTRILLEETAFITDDVWSQVEPSLGVTNGNQVFLSTPWGKYGFFYKAFDEKSGFTKFHVKAEQCPRYSKEKLNHLKETLTEFEWYTLYEAEFVDQAENAIPFSLIKANTHNLEEIYGPEAGKKYILGVDCARLGADQTVYMVAEVDANHITVRKIIATSKQLTPDLIGRLKDLHKTYNFVNIYIDISYIGASAVDELSQCGMPVMGVDFHSKSKADLFKEFMFRMGKHTISYPHNEKLMNQMADLKISYTNNQQVMKIEAPPKGHDDFPMTLIILCKHQFFDDADEFFVRAI